MWDRVLRNSLASMISPTFSSLPTLSHISPSTNSSLCRTATRTFPNSSPMPRSLRWNSVPIIDVLLYFTFFVSDPSHSSTGPSVRWFPFLSRMLSTLDSAAVPHLLRSTGTPFRSPFAYLSYGHWSIPSHTISPFPFSLLSSRFFLVHACLCTVYKPLSPVSCPLASSTQFSLVSSLPRFALRPLSSEAFPQPE